MEPLGTCTRLGRLPRKTRTQIKDRAGARWAPAWALATTAATVIWVGGACPDAAAGLTFVDAETPGGSVDGSNSVFTLSQVPNPVSSVALYRNGLRLRANLDYTLSSNQLVFQPGLSPQSGDVLLCSYRR